MVFQLFDFIRKEETTGKWGQTICNNSGLTVSWF